MERKEVEGRSHLQSQSKMLGHFAVFLVRFGDLTAINNIGRTRRWARSEKTVLDGSVPTIFIWDFSNRTRDLLLRRPRTKQLCYSMLQARVPCVASVSDRVIARKFLFYSLPDFLDELARKRLLRRLKQEVIIGPIMISCSKVLTLKCLFQRDVCIHV